jgi:hypothetical protein
LVTVSVNAAGSPTIVRSGPIILTASFGSRTRTFRVVAPVNVTHAWAAMSPRAVAASFSCRDFSSFGWRVPTSHDRTLSSTAGFGSAATTLAAPASRTRTSTCWTGMLHALRTTTA